MYECQVVRYIAVCCNIACTRLKIYNVWKKAKTKKKQNIRMRNILLNFPCFFHILLGSVQAEMEKNKNMGFPQVIWRNFKIFL